MNLKNILMPPGGGNGVEGGIKTDYFLPLYNNSPNNGKARVAYHTSTSSLQKKKKERSVPNGSSNTKNTFVTGTSNNLGSNPALLLGQRTLANSHKNALGKKKSYSFHKLHPTKE